jgi:hypothetical protein
MTHLYASNMEGMPHTGVVLQTGVVWAIEVLRNLVYDYLVLMARKASGSASSGKTEEDSVQASPLFHRKMAQYCRAMVINGQKLHPRNTRCYGGTACHVWFDGHLKHSKLAFLHIVSHKILPHDYGYFSVQPDYVDYIITA